MSNDETPQVPATRHRREAVREKAQLVQAKQSRSRWVRRAVVGVAALIVVAGGTFAVIWAFTEMGPKPLVKPFAAQDDGFAITSVTGVADGQDATVDDSTGQADPEVTAEEPTPTPTPTVASAVDIRVYVDYLSTGAREFQIANSAQLKKWVSQDAATLTYFPVAMLTSKSNGTKYSLRAAGAAACVATYSPDTFYAYNDELLRKQPAVDSDGMSDDELADLAQAAGVTASKVVRTCIEEGSFAAWARSATDRALNGIPDTDGVALMGTPTILVNGTPYVGDLSDPKEFAQFVLTVASDAYYRTPTPTPTPSPSASAEEPTPAPTS
ncbi:DsbA family protein [Microbacterium sp. RD1]|uniref:DsbA family protein n=1 Tax=Microbacterium sp. RD1 TaxID=3457313 RepID=UPI003FA5B368